jgi:GGDEF domain-containing protein
VLYLASRRPSTGIDKTAAYIALLMGIIVGELIERWWVARLRRIQMFQLHKDIDKIVEWIGTLSEDGPGLHDAIERLAQAGRSQAADAADAASVTLVVIDIDKYLVVQNTSGELIPMAAQEHVRRAIQKVLPGTPMYWFKNDHVLLLLEQTTAHQAVQLVDRIGQQVRLLPLSISGPVDERPSLTISAAIRDLTYQQLRDMAASDEQLREDLRAMIVDMRRKTKDTVSTTWVLSQRRGWQLAE